MIKLHYFDSIVSLLESNSYTIGTASGYIMNFSILGARALRAEFDTRLF